MNILRGDLIMRIHRYLIVLAIIAIAFSTAAPVQADKYASTIEVFKKSPAVQPYFKNAYGYAVFPTIGKGGIGIGAAYGQGQVYAQGKVTGITKMFKGSIGFQLGGQAFREIIFFEDKRAYDDFTSGTFEFDATASAVAITAGAQAKAGTQGATAGASTGPASGVQAKTDYRKGMAIFVHIKGGAMYEASIGGQKFTFEPK
jgi:lipid-binding SYLF domain-containing protein